MGRFPLSRPSPFSGDPSVGRTSIFNVTDYASVQAAIDACSQAGGGIVYFPVGKYSLNYTLQVPGNIVLQGSGNLDTVLETTDMNVAGDAVRVKGPGVQIRNIGFSSLLPRTGGSYVNFTVDSYECSLDQFHMEGAYIGVRMSGPTALYVEHGSIRNMSTAPQSCGILVDGGNDFAVRCVEMDNAADKQPLAGIWIQDTGCINITDCFLIHSGNDLLITGGYGIYAVNTFFDTAGCGIRILAQKSVQRCHFLGCWTSSHQEHGFLIEPNSQAVVDTIEVVGHQSCFNKFSGIFFGTGTNLKVSGSTVAQNGDIGLEIGPSAKHVSVNGNKVGSTAAMTGNRIGCLIQGTSDYVILTGNDFTGNIQGGIVGSCPHLIAANNFI